MFGPTTLTVGATGVSGLYGWDSRFARGSLPVTTFVIGGTTYTITEITTDRSDVVYLQLTPGLPSGEFILQIGNVTFNTSNGDSLSRQWWWWTYDLDLQDGDMVTVRISRVT